MSLFFRQNGHNYVNKKRVVTMELDFAAKYGKDTMECIQNYMIKYLIFDEYTKIKTNYSQLFSFGIKYGIIEIVRFLYETVGIEYDYDVLNSYDTVLKGTTSNGLTAMVSAGGGGGETTRIQVWDKFSKNRNMCIAHLLNIKKYSSCRSQNKTFYYRFNKKYSHLLK
jgi:hypothetical protein